MLSFTDIQDMIAVNFFNGDMSLAGLVMFGGIMILVIALTKGNAFYSLIVGIIVAMFFSAVGIISTELTILLIIIAVLGLAYTSRGVWND